MARHTKAVLVTAVLAALCSAGRLTAQHGEVEVRHWSGIAEVKGQSVPVRLDLSGPDKNGTVRGSFVNGNELSTSSSGELTNGHLVLNFDYFARRLEGTLTPSSFTGTFGSPKASSRVTLHPDRDGKPATRFVATHGAPIVGDWEIAVQSPKGESAWTLRVAPFGGNGEIQAVILRIDGDTGGMYGGYDAERNEYRVGHLAASGAAFYSLAPQADGTLKVKNLLRDDPAWTARRVDVARREHLAPPTKASEQTGVVDPSQPFQFSFPNLAGETVSNTDSQFRGKVVIVAIGGSWCPNCHDEAPFLVELYNRYHAQGLEVVDLSFEEEDQLKDPARLRAFVTRYRIPYTVLVAGTPDDLQAKIPQGRNLNCWPTSFFIGRDGLVKETHAGFSGPATGQSYLDLKTETTALVQRLLAEQPVATR